MDKESNDPKKDLKAKRKRVSKAPLNDGMNTPVPDSAAIPIRSESEEALYKQANNPLGAPNKV